MFCLLEDDSLITQVKVTTDRLLVSSAGRDQEVHLIIHVRADADLMVTNVAYD